MGADTFRFKRFSVTNRRSAMKVNTDGVLLGASMTLRPEDRNLLDIGTGTGTIALMAAQRLSDLTSGPVPSASGLHLSTSAPIPAASEETISIHIDAIDIDEPSATEAAENFAASPWSGFLHAHNMSLDHFALQPMSRKYDLIFSNPPYFEDSLTAPDERKSTARHTSDGLSYRDIFDFASKYLNAEGRVSLVLPADQENALCRYARMTGFHLFRILRIRTVPRKFPTRIIAEFSRHRNTEPSDVVLTIQNEGKYTQEYLSLTHDFYLFA
jgi:tRNA1Val (adenine37-N6)-methyltransferase